MTIFKRHVPISVIAVLLLLVGGCKKEATPEPEEQVAEAAAAPAPEYVGRKACIDCHKKQYDLFVGSDHDMAMDVATEETVLGDFDDVTFDHLGINSRFYKKNEKFYVHTEGPDGDFGDYGR